MEKNDMSISKINSNLPTTTKISNLSDQVLEIFGLVEKARFDKNEIDQLVTDFDLDRKYLRDVSLGHTLSTYSGWTHLHAESGYSLWKYSPTNYTYNSVNMLYLDDIDLENRGEANSESDTTFDKVFLDEGSVFTDNTTEAGTEDGTSFSLMNDTSDYLYVGLSSTFAGISFEFDTRGSNYSLEGEYWNGTAWTSIDISGATYTDDTSNFESDGRIYWDIPSNWTTTSVNSQTKYWVRISTSTTPVTTATAYIITPANSVISLLKMSSEEILDEDWAWCSYGTSIYVTIRNAGQSAYEGNYYITSSSTSINKQNYFIHNHEFTADYQDSTYISTGITLDNLSDVVVNSGLADGDVLTWDAGDAVWRNVASSAGVTNHSALTELDYVSAGHTGFEPTVAKGNLTELTSSVLTITGGSSAVIGSGTTIQVKLATSGQSGYLSSTDWTTFNNKQSALVNSAGLSTAIGGDVAVVDGGTGKSSWTQYLIPYADTTTSFSQIAIGLSGQVLTSNGAGSAPTFQTLSVPSTLDDLSNVDVTSGITTGQILAYQNDYWANKTFTSVIEFVIDGGGSAITAGVKGDLEIPFPCTITRWTLVGDTTGSISIDIWKDSYQNFPPTNADSIIESGNVIPYITSDVKNQSSTLTNWTTTINTNDILRFNVDSCSSISRCTLSLFVNRIL
jgi:hypothetical protein